MPAATAHDLDDAFSSIVQQGAGALMIANDPFFLGRRDQIVTLAAHYAIPTISFAREFTAAGGLLSYGASLIDANRQGGVYVGKVLNRSLLALLCSAFRAHDEAIRVV
jgi:hypothetical protein